jgi:hypothetical protein
MTNDLFKVAEDSARSSFFLISGTTLATIILAISAILIGRFLGPELYGQYSLTLTIVFWLIGWAIYFNASKHQHKTVRRDTKLSDNETLYIQFHVPENVKEA